MQKTLQETVTIKGIGLHSGAPSTLRICPAHTDTGIVFCREGISIPALYHHVVDTRNCTCLGAQGTLISTIEHLMAALYAAGIDNAQIECDNLELPILDGSAAVFFDILNKAPKTEQNKSRHFLKILKTVRFEDDKGNFTELSPSSDSRLNIHFEIDFPSKIVGHQVFEQSVTPEIFAKQIAPCRTFCEKSQIEYLQSLGLIKGGSLDNAVVLDGDKILNPGGFRVENECVNHKVLDAVGDLYTSGCFIRGNFKACRSGHYHNNELLKKLFSDQSNYEIV